MLLCFNVYFKKGFITMFLYWYIFMWVCRGCAIRLPLCTLCMCVFTITHFLTFVRLFDCVCMCVQTPCKCVCLCNPRKALGLQAAWWQCRWDNIWHMSDWVSVSVRVLVCVCVCVCTCVCVPLSPSGLPSDRPGLPLLSVAHWGANGTRKTGSSEGCLPFASLTSTDSSTAP